MNSFASSLKTGISSKRISFASAWRCSPQVSCMSTRTEYVRIVEVGPRDGLQNEKKIIRTADKIELVNRLSSTGLSYIESSSFVSPEAVPQLADGLEVVSGIEKQPNVTYAALTPTLKYLEKAIEANVKEVAFFTAASETFNQKNIRCSIEKSLSRASEMIRLAKKHEVRVRGYVSCIVGCPYEGKVESSMVLKVSETLANLGCYEISLGDTIGVATPGDISRLLKSMLKILPAQKLALHCHDTYGQALANILRGFDLGIRTFDSSIAGLGGCPYAPGASGNVATEDLVYMLQGMGVSTGVDFNELIKVSQWLSTNILRRPPVSKVAFAIYGSKCDDLLDRDSLLSD